MHPTFESWLDACEMMRKESARFRSYIQWYPFAKLSKASWELLESESYFNRYIKDGACILSEHMRFRTRGYIQKQSATMRDSHLVAPVMYLYLLAVGVGYERIYVVKNRLPRSLLRPREAVSYGVTM